jgi:hypothetical protein
VSSLKSRIEWLERELPPNPPRFRIHITTLHATLDVSNLAPGAYQLAVRRHGEDWRMFPVNVK